MELRELSQNLQQALDAGYKASQLWSVHNRVYSTTEKLNDKGSLMRGTVYVEWAFWLDHNIQEHAFIAVFDNGTDVSHPNFSDLKASLGIVDDPVLTKGGTQFEVKMSEWESEDQSRTVGLLGIYLVYLDNDDWIKVFDGATHGTASQHTFPVHKDRDFMLMIQENFDYEWTIFHLDGPIPTFKKHLRCDFRGAEMDVSMPTEVTCTVKITGRNLDKLWVKYL